MLPVFNKDNMTQLWQKVRKLADQIAAAMRLRQPTRFFTPTLEGIGWARPAQKCVFKKECKNFASVLTILDGTYYGKSTASPTRQVLTCVDCACKVAAKKLAHSLA